MAGDRIFNMAKGATYIEKQEINVQSGANFYNGSSHNDEDSSSYVPPVDAFKETVQALINQKLIVSKQDFSILYKLDEEMCLLGCSKFQDFADRINELQIVPEQLAPNADSIRALNFGSKTYPDWDFTGIKNQNHIYAVAKGYIREMKQRGYKHQNFDKI